MSLLDRIVAVPAPFDPARAVQCLGELDAHARDDEDLYALLQDKAARQILSAICGNSPYLTRTILRAPEDLPSLLAKPPEAALDEILAAMAVAAQDDEPIESLMRHLRIAKRRAHLLIHDVRARLCHGSCEIHQTNPLLRRDPRGIPVECAERPQRKAIQIQGPRVRAPRSGEVAAGLESTRVEVRDPRTLGSPPHETFERDTRVAAAPRLDQGQRLAVGPSQLRVVGPQGLTGCVLSERSGPAQIDRNRGEVDAGTR